MEVGWLGSGLGCVVEFGSGVAVPDVISSGRPTADTRELLLSMFPTSDQVSHKGNGNLPQSRKETLKYYYQSLFKSKVKIQTMEAHHIITDYYGKKRTKEQRQMGD